MKEYKYLLIGTIIGLSFIAIGAYALPAIDRTTTIQPFADNTYDVGADGLEYKWGWFENITIRGNATTTNATSSFMYISGDLTVNGDMTGTLTGNADTATSLAGNPTDCAANEFANAIVASGDLTCAALADADVPDTITASNYLPLAGGSLTGAATSTFWYVGNDLTSAGNITFSGLTSCDTIDTDADGFLSCGTDATGAAGGAAWEFDATNNGMTPTSTASGIYLQGSVTTTANIYVTGSVQITTSTILFNEDLSGSCDGATDAMTTANPFSTSSLQVYWNNRRLDYNDGDYSITLAAAGTFSLSLPDSYSCAATDSLFVDYVKNQF